MVKFNKIKDRTPEETIRKCKAILDDLGITVKEKWFKSADCFFLFVYVLMNQMLELMEKVLLLIMLWQVGMENCLKDFRINT